MENLYRLDDYLGKVPNPRHFPIRGGIITAVKDMPDTFSDGFLLEVLVSKKDREGLRSKAQRQTSFIGVSNIIAGLKESEVLLSEPEYIYDTTFITYIIFTPDGVPVAMQVKYYKYFRNRYPKCQFYSRGDRGNIIAVKVNNEVVGGCMPMLLGSKTIEVLKLERMCL
ncbi:unnamed protein product [marine sediment metagenome]|uniref:Uncharacterized protein n=1 Tax=marine sediment metagenome TaxID=412755 RepID=X1TJ36_9ZZZZ